MQAVAKVETIVRAALQPTKVNLAIGNVVPHLHWHVVIAQVRGRPPFPTAHLGSASTRSACPALAGLAQPLARGRPGNSTGTDGFRGLRPLIIGSTGRLHHIGQGSRLLLEAFSGGRRFFNQCRVCCVI